MTPHRLVTTVVPLVLIALLAAACGGGSGFSDQGGGGGEGEEAQGPAELQLMVASSGPAEDKALRRIVRQYDEQSDNSVKLNVVPEYDTTLQAALAAGDPPDVFFVTDLRLPDLVEAGALQPAEGKIDGEDDFYPSLKEAFTYNEQFWAPPKDFSTLGLQYNVDMLEEAGVDPPTTWDELAVAAEQLTQGKRVGLVIGPEYPRWGAFMFQAGGAVTNDDFTEMTVDSPAVTTALDYLQQMHDQGHAATQGELDAGWPGEAFGQGKAAMTIEGNWMVGAMDNDFPDINWATTELPAGPEGKGTFAFTVAYAVAANAKNPEASFDLVNFLVGEETMLQYTKQFPVMPSRQSLADDWLQANPDLEPFLKGAEYAHPFQFAPGFQGALDTLNAGIEGLAGGNKDPDQVISETQEAGQQVLGG